jgi:hypothetical protein
VYVGGGTFRISGGTLVGWDTDDTVKNEVEGDGWVLYVASGTAQFGSGTSWTDIPTNPTNIRNETIHVENGNLVL